MLFILGNIVFSENVYTVLETSNCVLFGYVQEIQNFEKNYIYNSGFGLMYQLIL